MTGKDDNNIINCGCLVLIHKGFFASVNVINASEREHFLEIFKIQVDKIYSALGSRQVPIYWLGSYVLIFLPSQGLGHTKDNLMIIFLIGALLNENKSEYVQCFSKKGKLIS